MYYSLFKGNEIITLTGSAFTGVIYQCVSVYYQYKLPVSLTLHILKNI